MLKVSETQKFNCSRSVLRQQGRRIFCLERENAVLKDLVLGLYEHMDSTCKKLEKRQNAEFFEPQLTNNLRKARKLVEQGTGSQSQTGMGDEKRRTSLHNTLGGESKILEASEKRRTSLHKPEVIHSLL